MAGSDKVHEQRIQHTFDKRGLEIWRPDDLALALHSLPALAAGDDSLYGVIDAGGGGDGVGEVVRGGDVYMLGEVVAVIGSHGGECARRCMRRRRVGRSGAGRRGRTGGGREVI